MIEVGIKPVDTKKDEGEVDKRQNLGSWSLVTLAGRERISSNGQYYG